MPVLISHSSIVFICGSAVKCTGVQAVGVNCMASCPIITILLYCLTVWFWVIGWDPIDDFLGILSIKWIPFFPHRGRRPWMQYTVHLWNNLKSYMSLRQNMKWVSQNTRFEIWHSTCSVSTNTWASMLHLYSSLIIPLYVTKMCFRTIHYNTFLLNSIYSCLQLNHLHQICCHTTEPATHTGHTQH